ncbi:ribbon-helix-helix domain-containing protein [Aurantimonas sp. MSK8Z-1]|uniref:ribbon-helix-helix domain-containing protein n=1 Tax=Mangrovibrevibacter kandeliae TaxID=2968473 RepID=UPI0021175E70|nr:ribbon-helix-helix domain-containing protein [Aurantimonas sp. MSK8Z-1]MCW4116749.1 ribbon-helix-helix domain-containing protein [Aurantimonas sp. MSK8Z-1]
MIVKRSITIRGHRTSISIEHGFWEALKTISAREAVALAALVAEIDGARDPATNLSSAIRLHVLRDLQKTIRTTAPPG